MRALVTGGTGFVGSAVVRALLSAGEEVTCLVRATSDRRNLDGLCVRLVQGDLDSCEAIDDALVDCQELYHVAAYYGTRPEDADTMLRVNVEGTRRLLNAAADKGLARIVHTSTIGTIGQPSEGRLATEADVFEPLDRASAYVRSKLRAEMLALDLARQGAPVVVVNPCAPVGSRDIKPSSTGQRILDYLHGRAPSFSPGGINFVAVTDVAAGHLLAAARGRSGQRYILGNAEGNLSREAFYALMQQASGIRPPGRRGIPGVARAKALLRKLVPVSREQAASDPRLAGGFRPAALTADPTLAIRELGLPQTPLLAAFRDAVIWFRDMGYV